MAGRDWSHLLGLDPDGEPPCEHAEVTLSDWRGEAGYVTCKACGKAAFVSTSYGWNNPEGIG